jgi:hypothetical protein
VPSILRLQSGLRRPRNPVNFPLDRTAAAVARMFSHRACGKVAITV